MGRWTVDEPGSLEFDGVVSLRVTLIAGTVSVLVADGAAAPSVVVHELSGPPLIVTHEAGLLSVSHEKMIEGVFGWLRQQKVRADVTVTVPRECPVSLTLVSAEAVVAGLGARASIRTASGTVTLDGIDGDVDVNTVSGAVEALAVDGAVSFTSVSGDLALAGGTVQRLAARTVSGRVAADVDLAGPAAVDVHAVSGEIALRVPESTGATVALNSAAGSLSTSFAELHRQNVGMMKNISGTIGDGSGRLSVTTVSGAVALLGRPDEPQITVPGSESPR
ncbi:DUF4097 family beta strand repeat-containing protein [Actinomadura flavalba]|uniref:DUF4097 family beta strand repeat-containing protein n=1 Tax=Actinomadura flavalba TaxID=1120938 RepID=UPI0003A8059B|nr:DUF4097 family beta strand repeat-containing protein [Actinomadura flavalba]